MSAMYSTMVQSEQGARFCECAEPDTAEAAVQHYNTTMFNRAYF